MNQELLYTSAPKGLRPGSRGFCTVISTLSMPTPLVDLLESLSGYRHLANPGAGSAGGNPVAYSHIKARIGGTLVSILSRVADGGLDYSGRSNKIAHHVALTDPQRNSAGPAATQIYPGFHEQQFAGEPRTATTGRALPMIDTSSQRCERWKQITGDAGWAGLCAERVATAASGPCYVIVGATMDGISLVEEVISVLPPAVRWDVTYSTFFTKVPPGLECRLRLVIDGTPEAEQARSRRESTTIDLTSVLPLAPESSYVEAARHGVVWTPAQSPISAGGFASNDIATGSASSGGVPSNIDAAWDSRPAIPTAATASPADSPQLASPAASFTPPAIITPPRLPSAEPIRRQTIDTKRFSMRSFTWGAVTGATIAAATLIAVGFGLGILPPVAKAVKVAEPSKRMKEKSPDEKVGGEKVAEHDLKEEKPIEHTSEPPQAREPANPSTDDTESPSGNVAEQEGGTNSVGDAGSEAPAEHAAESEFSAATGKVGPQNAEPSPEEVISTLKESDWREALGKFLDRPAGSLEPVRITLTRPIDPGSIEVNIIYPVIRDPDISFHKSSERSNKALVWSFTTSKAPSEAPLFRVHVEEHEIRFEPMAGLDRGTSLYHLIALKASIVEFSAKNPRESRAVARWSLSLPDPIQVMKMSWPSLCRIDPAIQHAPPTQLWHQFSFRSLNGKEVIEPEQVDGTDNLRFELPSRAVSGLHFVPAVELLSQQVGYPIDQLQLKFYCKKKLKDTLRDVTEMLTVVDAWRKFEEFRSDEVLKGIEEERIKSPSQFRDAFYPDSRNTRLNGRLRAFLRKKIESKKHEDNQPPVERQIDDAFDRLKSVFDATGMKPDIENFTNEFSLAEWNQIDSSFPPMTELVLEVCCRSTASPASRQYIYNEWIKLEIKPAPNASAPSSQ